MATIQNVLSDLEKQRRSWDEFKAAQNMRLSIAEKEIRALFVKTDRSDFSTQGAEYRRQRDGCC